MLYPIPFERAWREADSLGLTRRTRLYPDEIKLLCTLYRNTNSYLEVGVYDGLSAFLISTCTRNTVITLVDINPNPYIVTVLKSLGIEVREHWTHVEELDINITHSWCLLDADHSYEGTKAAYDKCFGLATSIVLHDVEMPEVSKLFNELTGVKIVSSQTSYTSPDGKVLPPLGYGIVK